MEIKGIPRDPFLIYIFLGPFVFCPFVAILSLATSSIVKTEIEFGIFKSSISAMSFESLYLCLNDVTLGALPRAAINLKIRYLSEYSISSYSFNFVF
jgi:hypothetical protein